MCGEYGEKTLRPHYHAAIFGHDFPDMEFIGKSKSGSPMYQSRELDKIWGHGFATVQSLTFESASYIARYILKKQTGDDTPRYERDLPDGRIVQVAPEYNRMSLNPGIGKTWFLAYAKSDAYHKDHLVHDNRKLKIPRYYDKLLEKENEKQLRAAKRSRKKLALSRAENSTRERLAVREKCHELKTAKLGREYL